MKDLLHSILFPARHIELLMLRKTVEAQKAHIEKQEDEIYSKSHHIALLNKQIDHLSCCNND